MRMFGVVLCVLVLVLASLLPAADGRGSPRPAAADALPAAALRANATALAAGGGHTCALTEGGGVMCWGANAYGQLGNNSTANSATPLPVAGLGSGVIAIAAGAHHTCAVVAGGGVKCWGWNEFGQLGNNTTADSAIPVSVVGLGSNITAVTAGWAHTCALSGTGALSCWGWNVFGELGNGTTGNRSTPAPVSGLSNGVTAITAGADHTCARTLVGGLSCWGYNDSGQLGDSTTANRLAPVSVVGLGGSAAAVTAGALHTCALSAGGGVSCWGYNWYGQLGNGSTTSRATPGNVSGLAVGVTAISAAGFHSCALTTGGGVMCWGHNDSGQLGDSTTTQRAAPASVQGLGGTATAIAAGGSHTCALMTGGGVKCWGYNGYGQLGDGTATDHSTPVDVLGLGGDPTATPTRTQTPTRTPTRVAMTPVSWLYLPVIVNP